jgi:hypothetical protein
MLGATSLTGCLETHKEKIYVRRVPPTKEELDSLPPPRYEDVLRRQDAQRERLRIPLEVHEDTQYLEDGRKAMGAYVRSPKDPWDTYESDRIRVLQAHNWADVGKSPPPEVFPRHEPPLDDDPFAPVAKMGKKKEDAEAPAEGDKGEKKEEPKPEEPKKK